MEKRKFTGYKATPRRKVPLPKVCYIFIAGEAFFYAAWVIIRYVAMLYPPTRCFDRTPNNTLFYRMSTIIGGFAGLILCALAEAWWGKYAFLYIFTGASIPSAIICWLIIPNILPRQIQNILCETMFITSPLFAASYPLRMSMISLQLPLPQHKKNVRRFYFYHWATSYAVLAFFSLVSFRGQESDDFRFWRGLTVCTFVSLGLIGYFVSFIVIRKKLVKLTRKKGIVKNELACLVYGMKYAFKNDWLEYTADKCSVETIENTNQVLNMAAVFTSFLMYYGNDQLLDSHFTELYTMSAKLGLLKYVFFNDIYYAITSLFLVLVEILLLPFMRKIRVKTSVLKLIGAGIAFQAVTTVIAHALEMSLEASRPPETSKAQLRIYNAIDSVTRVQTQWGDFAVGPGDLRREDDISVSGSDESYISILNFDVELIITSMIEVFEAKSVSYVIAPKMIYRLTDENMELDRNERVHEVTRPLLFFICPYEDIDQLYSWCNATVTVIESTGKKRTYFVLEELNGRYSPVDPGDYKISITVYGDSAFSEESRQFHLSEGGIYSILVFDEYSNFKIGFNVITILEPFSLSRWVWPMIFTRAVGTSLASVSFYTFTFIQAPPGMRTTLWGLHFFFENIGNSVLIILSQIQATYYRNIIVAIVLGSFSFILHTTVSSHFQYVNYYIF